MRSSSCDDPYMLLNMMGVYALLRRNSREYVFTVVIYAANIRIRYWLLQVCYLCMYKYTLSTLEALLSNHSASDMGAHVHSQECYRDHTDPSM